MLDYWQCLRMILYMGTISVTEAKARFSAIVDSASTTHQRFEITRNGERVAMIIGADDFDSLIETLEMLSDGNQVRETLEGMRELQEGKSVGSDEMREIMSSAGRLTAAS